jgi:putative ABC transport system ATP-binding protein
MLLEGKDLNLIYDLGKEEELYALRDVNISIEKGEILGVMGPSGSGKSSLLYVLSGLRKPMSGTVYYNDLDLESYDRESQAKLRRSEFGFIFQRHFLIDYLTILDNVIIATNQSRKEAEDKGKELLKRLKIEHLAGKRPFQLSGGQRQRTAIARALINDPSIVFADEPTASIDHRNAIDIMEIFQDFKEKTSIIIVTHDKSILENASRVLTIWDGRLRRA